MSEHVGDLVISHTEHKHKAATGGAFFSSICMSIKTQ